MNNINSEHYFDWAATAPFDTQILEDSLKESFESWGNPSSIYKPGTQAKAALNDDREKCAKVLDVNESKKSVTVGVDFMGGERKLEIGFGEIKKI